MNWTEFWKASAIWIGINIALDILGAPWWVIWVVVAAYTVYLYKKEPRNKTGGWDENK